MSDSYGMAGVPVDMPTERPLKVFISYRYAEMPGTAWALYVGLKERFSAEMLPDDIDLANYLAGRTSLMYCAISARSGRSDFSLTVRPPANWPRPE